MVRDSTKRVLFIGDIHIKHSSANAVECLLRTIKSNFVSADASLADPPTTSMDGSTDLLDYIVIAGDILDTHEKVDTQLLNRAYGLVDSLRQLASAVFVLVGNHDYINNTQFLTDAHWMNALKEWDRVTIVDTVIGAENGRFLFVPYVFPGRFQEALNRKCTVRAVRNATCIFAHQEFRNAKHGAFKSETGDHWPSDWPMVVSGHIHEQQYVGDNVYYPGSAICTAFGGGSSQGVSLLTFGPRSDKLDGAAGTVSSVFREQRLSLDIPHKRTVCIATPLPPAAADAPHDSSASFKHTIECLNAHTDRICFTAPTLTDLHVFRITYKDYIEMLTKKHGFKVIFKLRVNSRARPPSDEPPTCVGTNTQRSSRVETFKAVMDRLIAPLHVQLVDDYKRYVLFQ